MINDNAVYMKISVVIKYGLNAHTELIINLMGSKGFFLRNNGTSFFGYNLFTFSHL